MPTIYDIPGVIDKAIRESRVKKVQRDQSELFSSPALSGLQRGLPRPLRPVPIVPSQRRAEVVEERLHGAEQPYVSEEGQTPTPRGLDGFTGPLPGRKQLDTVRQQVEESGEQIEHMLDEGYEGTKLLARLRSQHEQRESALPGLEARAEREELKFRSDALRATAAKGAAAQDNAAMRFLGEATKPEEFDQRVDALADAGFVPGERVSSMMTKMRQGLQASAEKAAAQRLVTFRKGLAVSFAQLHDQQSKMVSAHQRQVAKARKAGVALDPALVSQGYDRAVRAGIQHYTAQMQVATSPTEQDAAKGALDDYLRKLTKPTLAGVKMGRVSPEALAALDYARREWPDDTDRQKHYLFRQAVALEPQFSIVEAKALAELVDEMDNLALPSEGETSGRETGATSQQRRRNPLTEAAYGAAAVAGAQAINPLLGLYMAYRKLARR